jgi:hypothetical protein
VRAVRTEEDGWLARSAREAQHRLEVLAPVGHRVRLAHLDREDLHLRNVRGEACDRLAARAADAREQRVAAWHLQHARDLADVLDGEEEEDELHRLGRDLVVVVEVLHHHLLHAVHVAHALVLALGRLRVGVRRVHEVAHVVIIDVARPANGGSHARGSATAHL